MTHFQNLLNRLDAAEHFLWILLDGRGDNFWCILVKNSCYDKKDVGEPKSFFVTLWKRWFSTDDDDSSPQDGDKISLQEG
ncbi:hypothetical protein JOD03_001068 [Chryseomicrobium aureum]|uniref:hypothetical protein n=1 Tax=Chryseomicrobium aureum TaxID=1441723 RepID=UPI001957B21A|nr:hypothetical protein [Chryseomicrobium aureum]MBM7706166.1 hypothetical protein [Chryseomicrobium aureum]